MQPFPKWALWLGGALVWVAGVSLALFALAAPARSEMAFVPEGARLVCAGAAPETLKGRGNALHLPVSGAARMSACRVEIDFAVRDPALAARAAGAGHVELVGLKRARAAFPQRLALNAEGLSVSRRTDGGLTLSIPLETLLGGERERGAALIFAFRADDGAQARTYLSPTLLIERVDGAALLRAKRAGN